MEEVGGRRETGVMMQLYFNKVKNLILSVPSAIILLDCQLDILSTHPNMYVSVLSGITGWEESCVAVSSKL